MREVPLHARDGAFTAPKSVAVDPLSGEVWLNADVIAPDGAVSFATFHLGADLAVRETIAAPPELLFVAFDRDGRGLFVEDDAGAAARARGARRPRARAGRARSRARATDFAQDVHFAADGTAAIAFWSGRVELVRERTPGQYTSTRRATSRSPPTACDAEHPALFYSAFAEPDGRLRDTVLRRDDRPRSAALERAVLRLARSAASDLPARPTPPARPRA